ncbi:hypothetical protein L0B53_04440 [Vibrio sp. SS-MA-C1-2]|uniref:hypothetical protein n=1 Tax=Vibrio sp. SS-MA-C1-2 TaxID=2908646 RepID=UPI001F44A676|nr:hypothetical protein [Vibrio sp. SS-MA-C1-2]UJF17169.1 hypothetical protein L0B53_04440 [Vibrio sp. SS-MA-C1-2]
MSYKDHKSGGFSNTHWLRKHKRYVNKNIDKVIPPTEHKLKVISLNIPCVSTKKTRLLGDVGAGLVYLLGNIGTPMVINPWPSWVGVYKSVENIENLSLVRKLNEGFVLKMNRYVDSWYDLAMSGTSTRLVVKHGNKVSGMVSGVVGMDFVGQKRQMILNLIEVNNRDF